MSDRDDAGAAKELIKKAAEGIATIFGPASKEIGEWLRDVFRSKHTLWEVKNVLATFDNVQAIFKQRAIEGKSIPIPLRQAMPMLEAIAQEDEPSIQEMWATLIANARDPAKRIDIKRAYTRILSDIDPLEAQVLKAMVPWLEQADRAKWGEEITTDSLAKSLEVRVDQLEIALHHLTALGCFTSVLSRTLWADDGTPPNPLPTLKGRYDFTPTELAVSLLEACRNSK
jgi:Abortive infection alpha